MVTYQIVVNKEDESIIYNFETYKQGLEEYKNIKSNLSEIFSIEYNKIDNGEITELFTKNVSGSRSAVKKVGDIANTIDDLFDQLYKLKTHHEVNIKIAERKRELNLHLSTAVDETEYKSKEAKKRAKLKIFDDISNWETIRRNSKEELENIYIITNKYRVMNMSDCLKTYDKSKINVENIKNDYEKTVKYTNNADKKSILSKNKKYAFSLVDELTGEIYFYNKFDKGRSKRELEKVIMQESNKQVKCTVNEIRENTNIELESEIAVEVEVDPPMLVEEMSLKTESVIYTTEKQKKKHIKARETKYKYYSQHIGESGQKYLLFSNLALEEEITVG